MNDKLFENCRYCESPIVYPEDLDRHCTIKKYCSAECRNAYWNDKRSDKRTWGEYCDKQYGKLEPLKLTEFEKGWLAAAIDGEGTIGIYREKSNGKKGYNRYGYRFKTVVEIFNTNTDFCKYAAKLMRGRVVLKHTGPNRKDCYKSSVERRHVVRVLKEVLPHLIIKREQAELALELCQMKADSPIRSGQRHEDFTELWQQMKTLNQRGPTVSA